MVWKDGLLQKLRNLGITNRMHDWIADFLSDRTIQVRVGIELSTKKTLENGTPQGSVLSPILFLVMFNDIPESEGGVELSMFADDCAIWKGGRNLQHNSKQLQKYFDRFQLWCDEWGFRISKTKTTAVVFTNGNQKNVHLKIKKDDIRIETTVKFLGMIFDQRLTWNDHIKYIVQRCNNRLNILRSLTGTEWGAEKRTMVMLYRTLIRSVIDYGSIAYDTASKSSKNLLNIIQAKSLRICCGAMLMTPVAALQLDCGETPLDLRRQELQLQYAAKLEANRDNPTGSIIQDCWQNHEKYPVGKEPFATKTNRLHKIDGLEKIALENEYSNTPFWKQTEISVDSMLAEKRITISDAESMKKETERKISEYQGTIQVFTDASVQANGRGGIAIHAPSLQTKRRHRISDHSTVFSAEASAILQGLQCLEEHQVLQNSVIFSDCLDVINSLILATPKTSPHLIQRIRETIHKLQQRNNIRITVVWIPGHIGIPSNEAVDKEADAATRNDDVEIPLPVSMKEVKENVQRHVDILWQKRWSECVKGKEYRDLEPIVSRKIKFGGSNRRREVIMTRLRLGKAGLNHYLQQINKHESGLCNSCHMPETIEHFILECSGNEEMVREIRRKCNEAGIELNLTNILSHKSLLEIVVDHIINIKRTI